MNTKYFVIRVLKKWYLMVIIAILASTSGFLYTKYVIKPQYEALTKLYIIRTHSNDTQKAFNYDDIMVSKQLAKDYKELLNSQVVIEAVMKDLNITEYSDDEFADKIDLKPIGSSDLVQLTVKDRSAQKAKEYADYISKVLIDKVGSITRENNLVIVEEAKVPKSPTLPKVSIYTVVAGLLGFFSTLFAVIMVEFFDNSIKTAEDLEKRYKYSVLGIIPEFDSNK